MTNPVHISVWEESGVADELHDDEVPAFILCEYNALTAGLYFRSHRLPSALNGENVRFISYRLFYSMTSTSLLFQYYLTAQGMSQCSLQIKHSNHRTLEQPG